MELIQANQIKNGTLVITPDQTNGKGQRGNSWETQKGKNITCTFILDSSFITADQQFNLSRTIALACTDFLQNLTDQKVLIKWPNDIYIGKKKIGGILIENTILGRNLGFSAVGIGININQTQFNTNSATSLKIISPKKNISIETALEKLSECLETRFIELKTISPKELNSMYLARLMGLNQERKFADNTNQEFIGIIKDVNGQGYLEVEINKTIRTFDIKELRFIE